MVSKRFNPAVNIAPPDQLDADVDDDTALKIALCFIERWRGKYPGRPLAALHDAETSTKEQHEAEIERALRIARSVN